MSSLARVVAFTEAARNQARFELCYAAILLGAPKGARGLDVLRREARLLDALDAISTPDPASVPLGPDVPRRLVTPDQTLVLLQPDFELLTKYLAAVEWTPRASRDVVDTADWLSAAPQQNGA